MDNRPGLPDNLVDALREREKELDCLYRVEELISNDHLTMPEIFSGMVSVLPSGWRFPELCCVKIIYNHCSYQTPGFISSPLSETAAIKAMGRVVGSIEVVYIKQVPETAEGCFLEKEHKLIKTVAERIGQMIVYRQMKSVIDDWEISKTHTANSNHGSQEWGVILEFIQNTNHGILMHLCQKLINHMLILGIKEASHLLDESSRSEAYDTVYANAPTYAQPINDMISISNNTFQLAEKHIGSKQLTAQLKRWILEESAHTLAKSISSLHPSLRNIIEELGSFRKVSTRDHLLYSPKGRWLTVSLIRHILSDKPEFINIAKRFIDYTDFFDICERIIYPLESQGRLGGKSTGLFLAQKIIHKESENTPLLESVLTPKTWYITTDAMNAFLQYNNLEDLYEQKYKEIQEIRIEYPNVIKLMKNGKFPPEIIKSLSVALDDFGDKPLIVRSSSILEDQIGAVFSGKYKSLFLANQGTKKERLEALTDAIIEVYASVFGSDPIQYRAQRGMLDFYEEMGILIQEVVGKRVGKYYFPLFSGVAFSNNEYRWSPRIRREDGLIRAVPGLGTRAVDRLTDDFPVLVSPEQPGIRVNNMPEEKIRYSPKMMDVINLEENRFETVPVVKLLKECGNQIERIDKIVSLVEYDHIRKANTFEINFEKDNLVVTLDGVLSDTPYIRQIGLILKTLKQRMGFPVDIEFACDGNHLYLLQCRPQSSGEDVVPAPIPQDLPRKDILFSANRYISNGLIQNISHIVYIDPDGYSSLAELTELKAVGRIVGLLNSILPKRQFVLIGPGRWGSRGDIKLGVSVSYSDISNTCALIEVARKKSGYMPELSFGTHFFQDLVEANIRFLPLYPDEQGIVFNEKYLTRAENVLTRLLPEYKHYEHVVRVIHVPHSSQGYTLSLAMNADLGEALGFLTPHPIKITREIKPIEYDEYTGDDNAWRWRHHMAEQIALQMDYSRFHVKAIYLFGSTSDGTAGSGSDIDLLIHFYGNEQQKKDLMHWLDGWSQSLAEINFMKTGYRMHQMLDIHIITDEDIRNKDSFAIKIDHPTEPAQLLGGMKK